MAWFSGLTVEKDCEEAVRWAALRWTAPPRARCLRPQRCFSTASVGCPAEAVDFGHSGAQVRFGQMNEHWQCGIKADALNDGSRTSRISPQAVRRDAPHSPKGTKPEYPKQTNKRIAAIPQLTRRLSPSEFETSRIKSKTRHKTISTAHMAGFPKHQA
jgi:hypothetical protein